jgi:O-antigen/teichoic acid export membrane protein
MATMSRFGRLGLGVVDQGLSSLSNVLFLVVVAREAGLEEFGAVSFAYTLFAFGLAVQRMSMGTLTSLEAGKSAPPPVRDSLLWAAAVVVVGVILGGRVGGGGSAAYYLIVAGCFVIYPQDLLRYKVIAERRVGFAVASDASWVLVTLTMLVLSILGVGLSVTVIVFVWMVLGAGLALTVIAVPLRRSLTLRGGWFRKHRYELRTLGPDALLTSLAPLLLASVLAQHMSLGDVAAVRGAGTLLGPATMLFSALPVVLLPEMARVFGEDRSRLALAQAGVMSVLVLAWGGCVGLLPDSVGEQVLGAAWAGSRAILWWSMLDMVLGALASGPIALLGTYRKWATLLLVRVVYLATVAGSLVVTVSSGNLVHVMIGMVFASALSVVVLGVASRREHALHR